MDVEEFLARIRRQPDYESQLAHVELLPERSGQFALPERPLPQALQETLQRRGIDRLYTHQVAALDAARSGRDWVVVTGTASGKTLCYNLPVLEACLADPEARALYLFPTKALTRDQLGGLLDLLADDDQLAAAVKPGVFDGDTPTAQRRRVRAEANVVLSNPDMLHATILPYHPKWAAMLAELRFVVLDEVHTYRGILGANVACVLRRLFRVCAHYGSRPVVLAASATIANPGELTGRLVDRPVQVIDHDGAPRGRKYFALWNPCGAGSDRLARRSATDDAVWLMAEAIDAGAQTLAFTRTRQAAELVHRYVQDELRDRKSPLADRVRAYRGGYLPNERRQIEQDLFHGRLRGVATTNALELGIDVGSLDVAVLVNYPGTIASAWQQAGRSGRRHDESLAVLIAANDPIDQYLLRHPDYFFAQSPEHAVVDPENPYVLTRHLTAAAFELPLDDGAETQFGELAPPLSDLLCDAGQLSLVAGKAYFAGGQNPAHKISLRHMSDNTFSIVLVNDKQPPGGPPSPPGDGRHAMPAEHRVIANVDAISAPELVYPEAVYLHNGESYFVRELDLDGKVAYVQRHEMDYYTQAVLESNVRITEQLDSSDAIPDVPLAYGKVDVSWQTVAFKKIRFTTRENVGYGPVDIPAQNLPSTAFWLAPEQPVRQSLKAEGYRVGEGLCGLRNLAVVALPMVAMCDSRDISGVVDSQNMGRPAMILYDRYPGGLGYCEKGYAQIHDLLTVCHQMVAECGCRDGCPSCVGLPNLRPAIHSDPDLTRGYPIPNKAATLRLLEVVREPRQLRSPECVPA
jgi:DEAD/DEAH box helicase domain-containing protein